MLTRALIRRVGRDAMPSDNPRVPILLSSLTRHCLPTPSLTPSPTSSLSCRYYAKRSTGTQTLPREERRPPAPDTPKPKKTAAKKSTKAKKKPARKTAVAKKKPARKTPAKKTPAAKKKPRTKKSPTQLEKQRAKVRQLKSIALLNEPKRKPTTVWGLIFSEAVEGENVQMRVREKAAKYRSLQASEREAYAAQARANAGTNSRTFTTWLHRHTPDEVRVANNARTQLSRIHAQPLPQGRKQHLSRAYHRLRDDRAGKRPQTAYSLFLVERHTGGDFKGMTLAESAKTIGREWRALSEAEKKKYQDTYTAARATYDAQLKDLFPTMKRNAKKNTPTTMSSTAAV